MKKGKQKEGDEKKDMAEKERIIRKKKRKDEKKQGVEGQNNQKMLPSPQTLAKYHQLKKLLASMGKAVVAYSGGVDSTFLLYVAHELMKDKVLAVVAESATYPESEVYQALRLAKKMGIKVRLVETKEMANPAFLANPPDRCYHCKQELFSTLKKIAIQEGISYILDGTNYDDLKDYRPGTRAAKELGVRSPLAEAKLTKEEIRQLSRWLGLPTWDKPSLACLASRFPYFTEITPDRLAKISRAEAILRQAGFRQVRARHQSDDLVRIEIEPEKFSLIIDPSVRKQIVKQLKSLGYIYITLDLEGYRSGSLNLGLKKKISIN